MKNGIYNMDCFDAFPDISEKSIDMILCDLPYGCLNRKRSHSKCDIQLPLDKLWKEYKRIIKDNGAIILFGSGMFTADLMKSNPKWWRYNLIWKKGERTTGFLNARRMPLRNHEDICVFYKRLPTYNPQMEKCEFHKRNHSRGNLQSPRTQNCYGDYKEIPSVIADGKFPKSIIDIQPEHKEFYHPSQKPIKLLEWLIKTYSNKGDLILDNCAGSGSTAIAAINTEREFLCFEKDEKYFEIASQRIQRIHRI